MKILLATALLAAGTAAVAEIPEIYPVPQVVLDMKAELAVPSVKYVGKTDADAMTLMKSLIKEDPNAALTMTFREMPLPPGVPSAKVQKGRYTLTINEKGIDILSYDNTAAFYAVQTLSQILKEGKLPQCTITDWPDIPFRGTVEGFYGQPWSHEARLSQFRFYGKWKLNTYIYGPKDDPFHGFSNRWREPYPADKAEQIKELVKASKENKVNFVWAVHPGRDIKWGEKDLNACINKFQLMYDLGVRSFGVFFDDIGGEGAKAEGQVEFLNALNREFILKKNDVTPLIMCPTQYNRAWSGGNYLDILGTQLDSSINIMWTGNSVVHDITLEGLEWVNKRIRRPAFIWWNFPVTDFVRDHLLLGRVYGLAQDAQKEISGFTSNPMDKPEASKITLFSIADYCWNMKAFNSEKSWKAGIARLFPECAEEMQCFANHNSDHGSNGHGYRREESMDAAPLFDRALVQYRKEGKIDIADRLPLNIEFTAMHLAATKIKFECQNKEFVNEVEPWLDAFGRLGTAGSRAVALTDAEDGQIVKTLADALAALERMKSISETKNRNPHQPGVKTGSLRVMPFVTELLTLAAAKKLPEVTGVPLKSVTPITNAGNVQNIERMINGNPSDFVYVREIQKVGDWFGLDLGTVQKIHKIDLLMGRHNGDHDIVHKGVFEISTDGNAWTALGGPATGEKVEWKNDAGVDARYVRYRSVHAGKLDGSKNDVWTAIRDFSVNGSGLPTAISDVPQYGALQIRANAKEIQIDRVMEVGTLGEGKSIGIHWPQGIRIADVRNFRFNLDAPNPGKNLRKEVSMDGQAWTEYDKADKNTEWPYIRVVNISGKPIEIKLNEFKLVLNDGGLSNTARLTDGNLLSWLKITGETKVTVSSKKILVFGDAKNIEIVSPANAKLDPQGNYAWITLGSDTDSITLKPKSDTGAYLAEIISCKK